MFAQNVKILGVAQSFPLTEIWLIKKADFLSQKELKVAETKTDNKGNFQFEIEVDKTTQFIIRINEYNAYLYAEANKNYEIIFPKPGNTVPKTYGDNTFLELQFKNLPTKDLNFLINDFDKKYKSFLSEFNYEIVKKEMARPMKVFKNRIEKIYGDVKNDYFSTYVNFSYAGLESIFLSRNFVFKNYFKDAEIQYNHHEYFNFFDDYYKDYVYDIFVKKRSKKIDDIINKRRDYEAVIKILKEDSLLADDRFCELILLKGLKDLYYKPEFKKEAILNLLQILSYNSKFEEHKLIAKNIKDQLTSGEVGKVAPPFTLSDIDQKKYTLKELNKKPVYLFFFASWNIESQRELENLEQLSKKYGRNFQFVAISLDAYTIDLKYFLKNKKFSFPILSWNDFRQIKYDYNVKSVPFAFIINDGKFFKSPALLPMEGLENDLILLKKTSLKNKTTNSGYRGAE